MTDILLKGLIEDKIILFYPQLNYYPVPESYTRYYLTNLLYDKNLTTKVTTYCYISNYSFSAYSQTGTLPGSDNKIKPDDKTADGSSSFKFGVSYLSNNVFMGRSDTVTTPIISPQVKYTFKSGLYLSGSLNIIPTKAKKKLDGGDITGGYDWDITDNLSMNTSLAKLFYSSTSTQISSSGSATVNAGLTYDVGDVLSVAVTPSYNFNKQGISRDFFAAISISHDFIAVGVFGESDIFLASPTVTANAGTENFYDAYLSRKN